MGEKRVTEEQVLAALRQVRDPELHRDIVTLGMIKDLHIEGGKVAFRFVLTTPACPVRNELHQAAEQAARAIPGVETVEVKMDAQVTKGMGLLQGQELVPTVRNIIAVASGKGGVGKSTVSVNLAVALAETGARVGLLDADITGPNIPLMMGVKGKPGAQDGKIRPLESYGVQLISIGFLIDDNTPVIWRGPMIAQALRQFFGDVAWGDLDYMIVDLPPGTGDAALSVAQLVPLSGGVIVTTPQDVALLDVRKQIAMFQRVNVPVLGIVENMSYFICPHCGERTDILGSGGGERLSKELSIPFLGAVPIDPAIREGGDTGVPIVKTSPDSPQGRVFQSIARLLAGRVSVVNLAPELVLR